MPPQPKANQKAPEKAPEKDPYEGLSDEKHNDFAQDLIGQADSLQAEKKDLLERIDNNRTLLRQVVASGFVSEKQAKYVEITYPPRKKNADESTNGAAS